MLPFGRAYYRTRDAVRAADIAAGVRHANAILPAGLLLRLIVPGWSHFALKQPIRGHLFLWSFVLFVLLSLFCLGSTWGAIWLGMAFSVHSSAAMDIVTQTFSDAGVRDRIVRSLVISAILGVLLYWPAIWFIGGVAQPHTVQTALAAFQPNDVVLVNQWAVPKRGDIVLYEINYAPMNLPNRGREHVVVWYNGENIDRILAVPGDRVQCDSGRLLVNGSPSAWQPLNSHPMPQSLSLTMQSEHYLILPSGTTGVVTFQDVNFWKSTGDVERGQIVGRAWLQTQPLSRFHVIR